MNYRAELYPIPNGWEWSTVGETSTVSGGLTKNSSKRAESQRQVPLVSVAAVQHRFIDARAIGTIGLLDEDGDKGVLRRGDVLVVEGNGSLSHIGRVALWDLDIEEARHQNHIICVRPKSTSPTYVLNWLASPSGRDMIVDAATSAAGLYTLSLSKVEALPVPVPPASEQRRIVDKLEALSARSRRAKEALDAIPPLLERFRQSVLASAFRGDLTAAWREKNPDVEPADKLLARIRTERRRRWEEAELAKMRAKGKVPGDDRWKEKYEEPEPVDASELPGLPEGWAWASVGEIGEVVTGSTPPGKIAGCYGGETPFYKPTDLDAGYRMGSAREHLTILGEQYVDVLPPMSVLVTCIGATIGKAGLARVRCATNQQINAIVPGNLVEPAHVYWFCAGPRAQEWIRGNASATTLPILNKGRFQNMPVPIPPRQEQILICKLLDVVATRVHAFREGYEDLSSRTSTLEQSILGKAFRGELVPQDPNDEPASVLLERIRAEADKNGTPARPGRRRAASVPLFPDLEGPAAQEPAKKKRPRSPARAR